MKLVAGIGVRSERVQRQPALPETVTLEIRESDDPQLLGNRFLRIRPSRYVKQAKVQRPHALVTGLDRRRGIALESEIAHLLVVDLLKNAGWKIAAHSLGRGTHPVTRDPVEFIERTQERRLPVEIRAFLSRKIVGIPGLRLAADLLIADKRRYALLEIKSTVKNSPKFPFGNLGQLSYYLEAAELGIPVKLVHIKLLQEGWKLSLTSFPNGELVKNGAIAPMLYSNSKRDGKLLSLLILQHLLKHPSLTPAGMASAIGEDNARVAIWMEKFRGGGLIEASCQTSYCHRCKRLLPEVRVLCPYCGHFLDDVSSYILTDLGLKKLMATVKQLRNHHEFLSKRILASFDTI